jgi:hypothetical protein
MVMKASGEFKTNDELCKMIRWYWADKRYAVKAWVEMSDDYIPPRIVVDRKGVSTQHDGFRARIPIIKSDLGPKGWPRRFADGTPVYPEPPERTVAGGASAPAPRPHPDIIGEI